MSKLSKKRWYDRSFRDQAVALAEEIGCTHAASKLGVLEGTLSTWMDRARRGTMGKTKTPEQQAIFEAEREIERLRKENEELKKANTVLKAVASYFHKDRSISGSKRSLSSRQTKTRK